MTHYKIHTASKSQLPHSYLIGPPLIIISAFCFGLVLMQPHPSYQTPISAAHPAAAYVSNPQPSLTALSFDTQTPLPVITMTPPSNNSPADSTATPQTTGASPLNLQSDNSNSQTQQQLTTNFEHLTITASQPTSSTTNASSKTKAIHASKSTTKNKNKNGSPH